MRNCADKIKKIASRVISGLQLPNDLAAHKYCKLLNNNKFNLFRLYAKEAFKSLPVVHFSSLVQAPSMASIILEIEAAFSRGMYPEVNLGGTSESYVLKDQQGLPLAIFKPMNSAWDNDAKKEIAAYRLDHFNFARVPPTVMATFSHPYFKGDYKTKRGSCQLYVSDALTALHINKKYLAKVSEECIRRIAMLDIRLINPDRHTSNLLFYYGEKNYWMIPIDHGAVLPEHVFGTCYAWLNWEQAKSAFTQEELLYIKDLNPITDAQILINELQIRPTAAENMMGACLILKEGATRGFNVHQIGKFISRSSYTKDGKRVWEPSLLEKIMRSVREEGYLSWKELLKNIQLHIDYHLKNYAFSES